MKTTSFIVVGFLATHAIAACAADFDAPAAAQGPSVVGKTRAEVKAETRRALDAGDVSFGDVGYPNVVRPAVAAPTRSRAEVKAETSKALAANEIAIGDSAYPKPVAAPAPGLARAEVKGELLRAIAAHELHFSETAYPDSGIYTTPRTKVRHADRKTVVATGTPTS